MVSIISKSIFTTPPPPTSPLLNKIARLPLLRFSFVTQPSRQRRRPTFISLLLLPPPASRSIPEVFISSVVLFLLEQVVEASCLLPSPSRRRTLLRSTWIWNRLLAPMDTTRDDGRDHRRIPSSRSIPRLSILGKRPFSSRARRSCRAERW